jgi:hypothetical protein
MKLRDLDKFDKEHDQHFSNDRIVKAIAHRIGYQPSEATRELWKEQRKGKIPSAETISKSALSRTGRKRTEEEKETLSKAAIEKFKDPAMIEMHREMCKNRSKKPEYIAKLKAASDKSWAETDRREIHAKKMREVKSIPLLTRFGVFFSLQDMIVTLEAQGETNIKNKYHKKWKLQNPNEFFQISRDDYEKCLTDSTYMDKLRELKLKGEYETA